MHPGARDAATCTLGQPPRVCKGLDLSAGFLQPRLHQSRDREASWARHEDAGSRSSFSAPDRR